MAALINGEHGMIIINLLVDQLGGQLDSIIASTDNAQLSMVGNQAKKSLAVINSQVMKLDASMAHMRDPVEANPLEAEASGQGCHTLKENKFDMIIANLDETKDSVIQSMKR